MGSFTLPTLPCISLMVTIMVSFLTHPTLPAAGSASYVSKVDDHVQCEFHQLHPTHLQTQCKERALWQQLQEGERSV